MNVALLNPCYWPEVRRGSERFVRELADGLLARGHQPTLITSHPGLWRRSVEDGLEVIRVPRPPQGPLIRGGFDAYLTHVPFSYAALRAGAYDIAHALYPADAIAAARWSRRTGRPAVLSYMGIPNRGWLEAHRLRLRITSRAVRSCAATVVLSRHAAKALAFSLGAEARIIAPGVDLEAFQPSTQRSAEPTIVCAAAAEDARKNVRLLIEAFGRVRDRHPEARLLLSRPRPGWADGVRSPPGVQWVDLDEREALAKAYAEAWVAALPAVDEAFGLVLIEALACGTPVVGYDHAGIPEIIDRPQIGRLFDRLEPDALARALTEVLGLAGEPGTAERCRTRAEEFSVDRCTDAYLALYAELLSS
jgi:phosphatidylinositol alpha-mannosyltransferase